MHAIRAFAGAIAFCACSLAFAQDEKAVSGAGVAADSYSRFWGEIDVGLARLSRTYSVTSPTTQSKFTLALRGGIALDSRLHLGVEFGGWTIESGDLWNPEKGEAIGTRFLILRYRPIEDSAWFLRGGGGRIEYWNNRVGERGASGSGRIIGLGYEIPAASPGTGGGRFYYTPSIDYSWGEYDGAVSPPGVVQNQRYRALSIRFGIIFR